MNARTRKLLLWSLALLGLHLLAQAGPGIVGPIRPLPPGGVGNTTYVPSNGR
jgi:hypothetical protein